MVKNIFMMQLKNGAKIIVSSLKLNKSKKKDILFIRNKNPRKLLSLISSRIYKLQTKQYHSCYRNKWKNISSKFLPTNIKFE